MGIPFKKEEKLNCDMNVTYFHPGGNKLQLFAADHSFAEGITRANQSHGLQSRKGLVDVLHVRFSVFIEVLSIPSSGMMHHGRLTMARRRDLVVCQQRNNAPVSTGHSSIHER